eukprot:10848465-Alexandrium_andersonii.AAC.1
MFGALGAPWLFRTWAPHAHLLCCSAGDRLRCQACPRPEHCRCRKLVISESCRERHSERQSLRELG